MRAITAFLWIFALGSVEASAQTDLYFQPIETYNALQSFCLPSLDAGAMGRGATGVVRGDDPGAVWWNPAALPDGPGTRLSFDYAQDVLFFDRWGVSGSSDLGPLRFGFGVDRISTDFRLRTAFDPEGWTVPWSFLAGVLAASTDVNALFDADDPAVNVDVGAAWRGHRIDFDEEEWSTGMVDVGVRLRSRDWDLGGVVLGVGLGASVANAGDAVIEMGSRHVPQYVRRNVGGTLTVRLPRENRADLLSLTLAHERLSLRHDGEAFGETELRFGADLTVIGAAVLRAGTVTDPVLELHDGFTWGGGLRWAEPRGRFAVEADYAHVETSGYAPDDDLDVFSLSVVLRDVALIVSGDQRRP